MEELTLKRGGKDVKFKKLPEKFAVRLREGEASDEAALEACCGRPKSEVKHLKSLAMEKMDVFTVKEPGKLEETMDELRKAPKSDVITHMYSIDETPEGYVIPTGVLTIQFKPGVSPEKREEILNEFGLKVLEELGYIKNGYSVRLTEASKENPLKIAAKLQQREEIEIAEPDLAFKLSLKYVPGDPLYPKQWHLKNRGNESRLVAGADVKAEEAWDYTRGSREIRVCIMDDGFELDHPDFKGEGKVVEPWDFGEKDSNPRPVEDIDNHGTACAGVAIAEENGIGVVGLAPGCAFMPIRTSMWLDDQSLVDLFQYAIDHNADVISCSWGAESWNFPLATKVHAIIHEAAARGRRNGKGCVILFAAGNEDRPLDGVKDGRISCQGFALHPDVITVAASNSRDQRSLYSNYGPEIAICAPSNDSTFSRGKGILTTDRFGSKGYSPFEEYTYSFGGTSSATPLAAGLAALMLSLNHELTSAEVKQIMMDTADRIDTENGGYVNGHSPLYGHGRINAHRALAHIKESIVPLQVLYMEHRIQKPIPDLGEVEDNIVFPVSAPIKDIEVNLDIKHNWRGDLRVILESPLGDKIILADKTGGGKKDIIESFSFHENPELFSSLIGRSCEGDWSLKVSDTTKRDTGTIKKWGLAISYR
ncbi:S8 family serine peptidase [Methanosarcina sp. KYL-1]|uniref:S8 family serine peptidase n=1 Tax=Methanosarcina sp. KYL-1 TaxID=2602068 RepID=UPI002101B896|nr:S8 family serine peptidase [Methanosarcina sp. KYL-1]